MTKLSFLDAEVHHGWHLSPAEAIALQEKLAGAREPTLRDAAKRSPAPA